MAKRIKVFAPASIANLGVGFDILGMAVDSLGDYVSVELGPGPGVELAGLSGDGGRLSREVSKNTATVSAQSVLNLLGEKRGIRLWLEKGLPLGSGLGSSAASAVAAAVATNTLLGSPLSEEDLLLAALDGEERVSARHADNAAPSLLGGIVLITGLTPGEIHRLPVPEGIFLSLVTPNLEIRTAEARAVLPPNISLERLKHQTGVVAELVHALHQGNVHLLAQSMQRDQVVEPARTKLIPGFAQAKELAADCGALASVISGSGPTLCSLCVTANEAEAVNRRLVAFYEKQGQGAKGYLARPSLQGARVVELS
jgi:homoserine kinase